MIKKSAAILAGGKSSRMNYRNKAFLKYEEDYFIERIIKALEDYEEIIQESIRSLDLKFLRIYILVKDL